jgi:FecR protein
MYKYRASPERRRLVRRLALGAERLAGATLMSNISRTVGRKRLRATVAAAFLLAAAIGGPGSAHAAGVCALVPNERAPTEKILQCGQTLTVHPAPGARYRPLYKKGDPLPVGIRLDDGALLIEFQRSMGREDFQILTPLAIAAVRGTKWAVDVAKARTSVLVLDGAVGVTNRRLNQYVIVTEGEGVDITPTDTSTVQKTWGYARVRALLSRFGE